MQQLHTFLLFVFLDLGLQVDRQHSQRRCHIFILDQNILGNIESCRSKGPDGFDATGDQLVRHFLSCFSGNGNDAHQNLIGPAEGRQLGNVINRLTPLGHFGLGIDADEIAGAGTPHRKAWRTLQHACDNAPE